MKRIISLSVALLMACVAFAQNITDSYRPGGFDYNGASIKTFSVSDTTAVQFSRGNLQYNAALDKWRFALRQYDYICGDNANISETYDGWIDLFGWGTSGWNSATAYQPWTTSITEAEYCPGGNDASNLTDEYVNADWGIYNKIENGGKYKGMWRLLTKEEWGYLIDRSGKYGLATIGDVYKGLVLLPDDWTLPNGLTFTSGYGNGGYAANTYTMAQWQTMEAAGAVFLPAAGYRHISDLNDVSTHGLYWSSTHFSVSGAWDAYFHDSYVGMNYEGRTYGCSVRLVRRVQKPLVQKGWVDMGLPSGTLWYSCNIGTTKPQGYGAYFAWGETKPKATYDWSTYAYGTGENALTKYYDGDGLTVLESGDDAARSAMGGDARMPSDTEWQELKDNCTSEWTTYRGVNGYMFTAKSNGNRLFFPAAGKKSGSLLSRNDTNGYYWSLSLNESDPSRAGDMYFYSGNQTVNYYSRDYGFSVRPVRGGVDPYQESLAEAFDANGASIKTFTVAEGRTVHFSKGNLWYNAAANLWRFAPEQYEYIGEANSNISETYNEYIDLFGWGTSGWNSGATAYQPWDTSTTAADYYPGGSDGNNLTGDYANADWGVYNAISNGGNQAGMWRTMTKDEWEYLLNTRSASTVGVYDNARYAMATVNNVTGVIILPDSFTMPAGVTALDKVNVSETVFSANVYNTVDWAKLESAGAIFLPAAGYRHATAVASVGINGTYWSSTYNSTTDTYGFSFYEGGIAVYNDLTRGYGFSVRLVKD